MTPKQVCGIIPARLRSSRFPQKPLALIAGRPLIEWVVRGCLRAKRVGRWIVATDDRRIADAVAHLGVETVMTPARLKSGSDRVAHIARTLTERWIVNWQGDEWLPDGRPIDRLLEALADDKQASVATLARPLARTEAENPNRVKVVLSRTGRALYFSRASIPHDASGTTPTLLHLGAYAFERQALLRFASWPMTVLERQERLEQLRLLEHDVPIVVRICRVQTFGVDTPADAQHLETYLKRTGRAGGR